MTETTRNPSDPRESELALKWALVEEYCQRTEEDNVSSYKAFASDYLLRAMSTAGFEDFDKEVRRVVLKSLVDAESYMVPDGRGWDALTWFASLVEVDKKLENLGELFEDDENSWLRVLASCGEEKTSERRLVSGVYGTVKLLRWISKHPEPDESEEMKMATRVFQSTFEVSSEEGARSCVENLVKLLRK